MNEKQPSVLVVILNYGTVDLTINLINELKAELDYDNYSIMVVDNCSPNESAQILEKKSQEMDFIFFANKKNAGYAAGNNIGIRYGIEHGFEYSWILNNDVELREKNVLGHMVDIASSNDKIGCIGPMIYSLSGEICAPYVNRASLWDMTLGILSENKLRKKYTYVSGEVYRVYGCCMLLKNSAMQAVDCMDERTFLYGEENILAERLMDKGYVSYYDSEVSVTHKESSSMKRMSKNRKKFQVTESKKSRELYLKEYRHFHAPARWMCHTTRSLITYLR